MHLALFDLDGTLLSGDSEALWCSFLIHEGLLDHSFGWRSDEMSRRYIAGTVNPHEYCEFYAGTVSGRDATDLRPVQERFLQEIIRPRIPDDSRLLLQRHRDAGHTILLTTATNRVVSELTARDLGVDHYLCTELERVDGCYTGRIDGALNMRGGKVERLRHWLAETRQPETLLRDAHFYTDSINDLALLSVVRQPAVVDPDARLESAALRNGWSILRLRRT